MEKSLNSSRNFKLPPIQGAAPAANILRQSAARQTWRHDQARSSATLPNHRAPVKPRTVIHVPKDPFPGRYRSPHVSHNLTAATQRRAHNAPTVENEKSTESKPLDFAPLRHQFPQSYSVLPPISIQKIQKPLATGTQGILAQDREKENNNLRDSHKSAADNSSRNDKQNREERKHVKHGDNKKSGNSNTDQSRSAAGKNDSTRKKLQPESHDSETRERKPSATTLLFLKGTRKGRRVGVCLENEPALINITEQLKEIFLRRNMEEMYLI